MKWVFDKYLDQLAAMVVFGQQPQTIRRCKIREMIFDDDELDLRNLLQDYKNKKDDIEKDLYCKKTEKFTNFWKNNLVSKEGIVISGKPN